MQVYYHIPKSQKDNILSCGMKLSDITNKTVPINGFDTSCIVALMHPKDDITKHKSDDYLCVRLIVKDKFCFIAESTFYEDALTKHLYLESIIPANEYKLGSYIKPECLVTCTILPENISIERKSMGYPLLYNNSKEVYNKRLIASFRSQYPNFDELAVKLLLEDMSSKGRVKKIETGDFSVYNTQSGMWIV